MKRIISIVLVSMMLLAGCNSGVSKVSDDFEISYPPTETTEPTFESTTEETSEEIIPSITYTQDTEYTLGAITFTIPAGWCGYLSEDSQSFHMGISTGIFVIVTNEEENADSVMKRISESYDKYEEIVSSTEDNSSFFYHGGFNKMEKTKYETYHDNLTAVSKYISALYEAFVYPVSEGNSYSVEYMCLNSPALEDESSEKVKSDSLSDFGKVIESIKFK